MALIESGSKFGQLEVIEEEASGYWRCRCLRCRSDGALATIDALLVGKVKVCFDCAALAKMTLHEKKVIAFRRSLNLTPPGEEIDHVSSIHAIPRLTIADALSEAA